METKTILKTFANHLKPHEGDDGLRSANINELEVLMEAGMNDAIEAAEQALAAKKVNVSRDDIALAIKAALGIA